VEKPWPCRLVVAGHIARIRPRTSACLSQKARVRGRVYKVEKYTDPQKSRERDDRRNGKKWTQNPQQWTVIGPRNGMITAKKIKKKREDW